MAAYLVAVFDRFSLGVAGELARRRFGISSGQLSSFSVIQLTVYAATQIPVGLLLDRFGAKRLIATGAVVMGCGQALFALTTSMPGALLARLLIGIGDGMTFISVLRLLVAWFPPRLNPLFVQLTGQIGALGAVLSATPLLTALQHVGWTAAFLSAAGLSALALVAVLAGVRDTPSRENPTEAAPKGGPLAQLRRVRTALAAAWHEPGTRLGLATHFATMFPGTVFTVLWGFPFLVQGEGVAPGTAGSLLVLLTLFGVVVGPVLGSLAGRLPYYRSVLVLGIVAVVAALWGVVLLWPGRAPLWLLVVLVLGLATTAPGSAIGFDYARTFNPTGRMGVATGIVNVGGFLASVVVIAMIGLILDRAAPGAARYPLGALKLAFASQYLVWLVGALAVLRLRRRTRATHGLSPRRQLPTVLDPEPRG